MKFYTDTSMYCFHHQRLIHTHNKTMSTCLPPPLNTHMQTPPTPAHLKPQVEASMHRALVGLAQILCCVFHAQMFCDLSCRVHQVLSKITGCHLCVRVCVCVCVCVNVCVCVEGKGGEGSEV